MGPKSVRYNFESFIMITCVDLYVCVVCVLSLLFSCDIMGQGRVFYVSDFIVVFCTALI